MAQTSRKLEPRDLCLIHGEAEPRISSIRLADRLHESGRAALIHQFIERNEDELTDYGNLSRRMINSGERGRPAFEYLLTRGQVFIVCMRSDSSAARPARKEAWELIEAYTRGDIPKSEITIIADLFAPARPTITRGDDNIVHVRLDECERKHEQQEERRWQRLTVDGIQGRFDFGPSPEDDALDGLVANERLLWRDGIAPQAMFQPTHRRELWQDGGAFVVTLRYRNEEPFYLRIMDMARQPNMPPLRCSIESGNDFMISADRTVPVDAVMRAVAKLPEGWITPEGMATIRHFFGD